MEDKTGRQDPTAQVRPQTSRRGWLREMGAWRERKSPKLEGWNQTWPGDSWRFGQSKGTPEFSMAESSMQIGNFNEMLRKKCLQAERIKIHTYVWIQQWQGSELAGREGMGGALQPLCQTRLFWRLLFSKPPLEHLCPSPKPVRREAPRMRKVPRTECSSVRC